MNKPSNAATLAGKYAKKFRFSGIEEATANETGVNPDAVEQEIREQFDTIENIATQGGVTAAAVHAAMQGLLDAHREGTDLDREYGASMAGVSQAVQEVVWGEIEQKYGKKFTKIAKEIFQLIDFDTAEKDDLKALSAILESGTIKGIRREDLEKMSGEEVNAIMVHAKEMTVPGEGFNTEALREAANAVVKGGIPELRKHEKTLGWNVE